MHGLAIFGALAVLGIAGASLLVLRRARALKARHARFLGGAAAPVDPLATKLIDAPRALYHGTRFADEARLLAPAWGEACVVDLWLTEEALFLQREAQGALLVLPLSAVDDAALLRAFAPLAAKELPMLRLRWSRGGETVLTDLSLRGGMASLETLRREIHLRQHNVAEKLAPLFARLPP